MASPDLLAEIAAGRRLRKVPDSEKKDRSAPITGKGNESNISNPGPPVSTSHSNGSMPTPMGLGGIFANGMPKLRPVNSSDSLQNIGSRQVNVGNYNKNIAPPPPQTISVVPPPATHSNIVPPPPMAFPPTSQNSSSVPPPPPMAFTPTSQISSSIPPPPPPPSIQPVFHGAPPPPPTPPSRPIVIKNESGGLRRAPPPTSAKPNIIPADTSLSKFISQRKMSTESPQPSSIVVRNSKKIVEYPTQNSNTSNSTVSITMHLPSPAPFITSSQPTSGGRKSSSSNRYQRAGSTSSTSNGTATKVIYVNNPCGNQIQQQQHQPPPTPSIRPTVPQTNLGTGVFVNLTHPAPPPPPPPPPPIPTTQPLIQYDANTLKRLAYEFEKRFNFLSDDDLPPIPKLGPKNYREGSKIPTRMAPSAPMNNNSMY